MLYDLVCETDLEVFTNTIMLYLEEGLVLHGKLKVKTNQNGELVYIQAVVRPR